MRKLLIDQGYSPDDMSSCLKMLVARLNEKRFPHEIGAFLGYPIEDVEGFIKNEGNTIERLTVAA